MIQIGRITSAFNFRPRKSITFDRLAILNRPKSIDFAKYRRLYRPPSRGHIVKIAIDSECCKCDHAHAYVNFSLRPGDSDFAYIALFQTVDSSWYEFRPSTLLLGSAAEVSQYNSIGRLFAAIVTQVLAIPIIDYYGDVGFYSSAMLPVGFRRLSRSWPPCYGRASRWETSICEISIYLALKGIPPTPNNGVELRNSTTPDRQHQLSPIIDKVLSDGPIAHHAMERLVAKLGFAQTSIYNRFARATTHPLYRELYLKLYFPKDHKRLLGVLGGGVELRLRRTRRLSSSGNSDVGCLTYTDASYDGESGRLGEAAIDRHRFINHPRQVDTVSERMASGTQ